MATAESYRICGPRGETLYPSPRNNPAKYRPQRRLNRDPKLAISQREHAELITACTQLTTTIPVLDGALRQMADWAFAGDSWQPIHYGEDEKWGDPATDWLVHQVYPNAIRRTPNKSLIKAVQVSAKSWLVQGDDLALFSEVNGMPKMTVIPATCIGNGDEKSGWWTQSTVNGWGKTSPSGYGVCVGGMFDGHRIYNGVIYDDDDEPVAVRVLGTRREGNDFVPSYADFQLGFEHGAHMAFPYDWHGMGRPVPRIATAVEEWLDFKERDDFFNKGTKLAASKTVIHQLAEGQDAVSARGDAAEQITYTDADGNSQNIWVETTQGGDVTYIGSNEKLAGMQFENPHPNIEAYVVRKLRENIYGLGWLFELIDVSSTGRAPTRLACDLANNNIWNLQMPGEERLSWFTKFAIITGIKNKHIPAPNAPPLSDDPYRWTFGYPKEISVDQGNDVTASLNRLRYGLTSQRVESARYGYVLKRIRRDRQKEVAALIEDAAGAVKQAKAAGHDLPFVKAMEMFWMPSANSASMPSQPAQSKPEPDKPTEKKDLSR